MFDTVTRTQPDALMLVSQRFHADERSDKLDLGVGVYRDAEGSGTVLQVVKTAEFLLLAEQKTKTYLPPDGDADFVRLMQEMILGSKSKLLHEKRVAGAQCPGGTGAFHQALALLKSTGENPTIWVGTPTWPNHIPMLRDHGFSIETYEYFDVGNQSLLFDGMMSALKRAKPGDVVLLHGVCHNPTGADLTIDQWRELVALAQQRSLTPLFDFAYQGFGNGSDEDAAGVRLMAEQLPETLIAASCSKGFGLYRKRTGILVVVCEEQSQAATITTKLQSLARLNYSNPPDHGGAVVRIILSDPALKLRWAQELRTMRERVTNIRNSLKVEGTRQGYDIDFITDQTGLFTTLAITPKNVSLLAKNHAIHLPETGRINISGISEKDVPRFVSALRSLR